ncbi:iron complex outermembrane recepter protein [Cohaesibacter marisflavi]|uniref:Iron complex outermembrane recepter protein n=1 Tax=Cohaesibacter marisflavi TaxID=655353 RepID=A0A1I5M8Y2_9HYPH|nr:TonB-dependent receptor [Cohaesibacter marisflavi]SFP05999.1 iron complex outermembrane recepter protein [Cohaesibacter marisflavi]
MLGKKKLFMSGISLIVVATGGFGAQAEDFIDTLSMERHALAGPPSVPSPLELLLADPYQQFDDDSSLSTTIGVESDVANANKTVKVMGGYDGKSNAFYTGAQAKLMAPGVVMLFGNRFVKANDYKDANGDDVTFGYTRSTQQVMIQWKPTPVGTFRFVGVRDVIEDELQPHHSMDVKNTERLVGKLSYDQVLEGDRLTGFSVDLSSRNVEREPDNYSNRDNSSVKMRAHTERHILDGKVNTRWDLGSWSTNAAVFGGWDNQDARRYNDTLGVVNTIKVPDVTRKTVGASLDGKRSFGEGWGMQLGMRYDLIHADPADANETGDVPSGATGAAAWNMSPASLYRSYYGATGDLSRTDNNISARMRVTKAFMDERFSVFGDLSRKVRSPDNIEAYHAVTHPQAINRWIGNPDLDPEAHHKAELGMAWKGNNYVDYGVMGPNADGPFSSENIEVKLSGYVDWVNNFITWDRAYGQSGVNLSDGALIYRNVDALFAGANFEARWNLTNHWSATAKVAYLWGNNDSDDRALYQIAPLEANFLLDYQGMLASSGTWNVGAKLRLVSDQTRVDEDMTTALGLDDGEGKGFATVDLYGGLQLSNRWSLSAGINNLFNTDYQEHITGTSVASATRTKVNAPGRTFFVRSQMNF